ncbi:hypothetical protein D7D52_13420 [Nocardia yunnanensis]|uniref:Uncharacterized protein n=1 Tax=Nocardia yunnanensis TaxID=2382165 RepID=A0A386ZAN8_9NOCA|nr:hypothetical protein [Nocardia yunnanensis]AYF74700.1 hypothetical protein D7D52_13420 [Nocardia yunnanensis]
MSAITTPRRRLALRLAAAGALAAIPLAVIALPANAATPEDNAPVAAQPIDGQWHHHHHHHDGDGWNGNGDNDNGWNGNGWDNNAPAPALPGLPGVPLPSTGSF